MNKDIEKQLISNIANALIEAGVFILPYKFNKDYFGIYDGHIIKGQIIAFSYNAWIDEFQYDLICISENETLRFDGLTELFAIKAEAQKILDKEQNNVE